MSQISIQPVGYTPPPIIPRVVPKAAGFNFLPAGTVPMHDAKKWALYYYAAANMSFLVVDAGKEWRITPYLGRMKVGTMQHVVAVSRPCCNDD